jgi:FixJ family two-component response regulator
VSLLIFQLLASKRFQFQEKAIKFNHKFSQDSYFVCIQANSSRFKRMLSNLVNNAVGAYADEKGEVTCELKTEDDRVIVSVCDQGKGIPPDVLKKIKAGIKVTSGKEDGHGIGLTQVRDTVALFHGELDINSTLGKGTEIWLSFPKTKTALWLADSITVNVDDTVVVLDDEQSMHHAWKEYFKQHDCYRQLEQKPVHFTQGQEAVDYINNVPDKDKLFLLTDYELLKQRLNGVEVIKRTGLKRVIVVTSYHDDKNLRQYILDTGIRLLPKQLVSQVPIILTAATESAKAQHKARVVILDDERNFTNAFLLYFDEPKRPVDAYNQPSDLLDKLSGYSKSTQFYLDHNLSGGMTGLDIAHQLYAAGYSRLFLLSGGDFDQSSLPAYVSFIAKNDMASIESSLA